MTFDEELEKGIAQIIGDLKCPKDFRCYRSGFENLCKASNIGLTGRDFTISFRIIQ